MQKLRYRVIQKRRVKETFNHHILSITGDITGVVGKVPCFKSFRVVNAHNKSETLDLTPAYFDGPATIEILGERGEVVGRFGIAYVRHVSEHPRGEVLASK